MNDTTIFKNETTQQGDEQIAAPDVTMMSEEGERLAEKTAPASGMDIAARR